MKRGIISYDITNTRERTKLYKILCGYGNRVQFSVFEFELEDKIYNEMFEKIVNVYKEHKFRLIIKNNNTLDRFSIRIYDLCLSCMKKVYTFGEDKNIIGKENIF